MYKCGFIFPCLALQNKLVIQALSSNMHIKLITFFSLFLFLFLFLVGCNDDAPRDKIHSFIYSTFYLKVIDQAGLPISGVETDITHGGNSFYFGSNSGWAKYISDSHGLIRIKVDSRQISIDRMAKDGYSINLPKILFDYYKTRSFRVPAQGDLWPTDFEMVSKKFPFIIRAWRIDENELEAKCKNGVLRKSLNTDGESYGVDLFKSGKEIMVEDASERSIQIEFNRRNTQRITSKGNHRDQIFNLDWNYSLTVANGGLLEIEPETLYKKTPPLSGYSEKWQLNNATFRTRSNEYGGSSQEDDRHFYLKINDEAYGRLSIRFKPVGTYRDDFRNGEIVLDYSVNTYGSRIVRGIDDIEQIQHRSEYHRDGCTEFVRGSERKNNRIYP